MKILIASGGSGGHIFPAVALASNLKAKRSDVDISFVGSNRRLDKKIFDQNGLRYTLLSSNKMPYGVSLRWIPFLLKALHDIVKGFFIVFFKNPDAIVGFGGYVSVPIVVAGCLLKIPAVVHEQNVVPGRANRFLFRFARIITVSFRETERLINGFGARVSFTGNPIRPDICTYRCDDCLKNFGFKKERFTILVMGGSSGSHNLNKAFVEFLQSLDENRRQEIQVIHIAGERDCAWVSSRYADMHIQGRAFSFLENIDEAYSACDLALTRSGSSALFELAYFAKPMILVPYPHAMSHQLENARVFGEGGAAICVEEKGLFADSFNQAILGLEGDCHKLKEMSDRAKAMSIPDASDRLADEVVRLVNNRW